MSKKKKQDKEAKKKQKKAIKKEHKAALKEMMLNGCKSKCCEKFKKSESKRCSRCPCFDLIKKVA